GRACRGRGVDWPAYRRGDVASRSTARRPPNRPGRTPGTGIGAPARHRDRGRTTSATVDEGWGKGGASRERWWLRYLCGSEAQYHTPPEDRQGGRSGAPHHGPPAEVHRHTDQHEAQSEKAVGPGGILHQEVD